jgi:superfamily II DNA or RNA helicase
VDELNDLEQFDELLLQQLLQIQYWNRRSEGSSSEDSKDTAPAQPLPDRWELTKGIQLHAWQRECVEGWFSAGRRGVIKVVTGAGKTILALAIAEQLQRRQEPELRVVIVVPTIVLLDQWRDELRNRSNLPANAIAMQGGGESNDFGPDTRILICVLNTAARKLPEFVREVGIGKHLLLIVDECHRAGASEMQKVFRTERAYSLGLSATPERENDLREDEESQEYDSAQVEPMSFEETVLGRELGPVIFELNYATAIQLGILPPFQILHYGLNLEPQESLKYERISREITDLRKELERPGRKGLALMKWCRSRGAASNPAAGRLIGLSAERKRLLYRMSQRSKAVVKILRNAFAQNPDCKAILFHESIEEVMRLFLLLRREGFRVIAEHSEFPDQMRATCIRLFRTGSARIIVSVKSLIEGFNVPSADLGIIVAASSSVRQRVQTLGRLLRKGIVNSVGEEKHAALHVLYATDTVDELIYEKADWEHFVGAERNQYFRWPDAENTDPIQAEKAPRSPAPNETMVDESQLHIMGIYPGDLDEGITFSRDTQGTIRSEEGRLIEAHPELAAILKGSRKGAGRFRVTPKRNFVVELEKGDDGWRGVYLGRLTTPIVFAVEEDVDVSRREWKPGDTYPLSKATGKTFSVLQRDPRLIAKKEKGRTRFVLPLEEIEDLAKRASLSALQNFLKNAYSCGHRISKVTVTPLGHVVYVFENQAVFAGSAPEGEAGFSFAS